jgi:hypothetical protein
MKRHRNQGWVAGVLVGMAIALPNISHATGANDNGATQLPTQEFNFRINGSDKKWVAPKAPVSPQAKIATRPTPLANSHDIGVAWTGHPPNGG